MVELQQGFGQKDGDSFVLPGQGTILLTQLTIQPLGEVCVLFLSCNKHWNQAFYFAFIFPKIITKICNAKVMFVVHIYVYFCGYYLCCSLI